MQIVIGLIALCLSGVLIYFLSKNDKIETKLKHEQLKYYQRFNELCDKEEEDEKD